VWRRFNSLIDTGGRSAFSFSLVPLTPLLLVKNRIEGR
jgi:hypothetical protein